MNINPAGTIILIIFMLCMFLGLVAYCACRHINSMVGQVLYTKSFLIKLTLC